MTALLNRQPVRPFVDNFRERRGSVEVLMDTVGGAGRPCLVVDVRGSVQIPDPLLGVDHLHRAGGLLVGPLLAIGPDVRLRAGIRDVEGVADSETLGELLAAEQGARRGRPVMDTLSSVGRRRLLVAAPPDPSTR
jgi:hypothetical protein